MIATNIQVTRRTVIFNGFQGTTVWTNTQSTTTTSVVYVTSHERESAAVDSEEFDLSDLADEPVEHRPVVKREVPSVIVGILEKTNGHQAGIDLCRLARPPPVVAGQTPAEGHWPGGPANAKQSGE